MKPKTIASCIILALFTVAVALYLTACARDPATGKWIPAPVKGRLTFVDDHGDEFYIDTDENSVTPGVTIKGGTWNSPFGNITAAPK